MELKGSHSTYISGQLQIDHERGVIYFHADRVAQAIGRCPTPLRICGLGQIEFPFVDKQVDLTITPMVIQDHQLNRVHIVK